MIKYIALLVIAGSSLVVNAQELADYKYIIVPAKFDFQKEPGQYNLNALSKFLFQKYGFNAFLSTEELPSDYNAAGCNSLLMTVDEKGFLSTKVIYMLSDCRGQVVYTSPEGKSKIKEFKPAFDEAFREAMMGLEELGYTYSDEIFAITENSTRAENPLDVISNQLMEKMQKPKEDAKKSTRMDKMPKRVEDKTVVVQAVPKPVVTEKQTETQPPALTEIPKEPRPTVKPERAPMEQPSPAAPIRMSQDFKSLDGSYSLKPKDGGFDLYEGNDKIGSARKTSGNSYLVNSSDFVGVGTLDGDTFTVEREIKGVQGLVKMVFKSTAQ